MSRNQVHTALNRHAFKLELGTSSMASSQASLPTSPVSIVGQEGLPTSVRGAAPELRRIIRKRQNSESAKRCRERKKIEDARAAEEFVLQVEKVHRLECIVSHLARRLEETRFMLISLTGGAGGIPEASQHTALCANGQAQCRGAECALCVRAVQAGGAAQVGENVATGEAEGEFHMAQRVDEHTVQLQQMLSGGSGSW